MLLQNLFYQIVDLSKPKWRAIPSKQKSIRASSFSALSSPALEFLWEKKEKFHLAKKRRKKNARKAIAASGNTWKLSSILENGIENGMDGTEAAAKDFLFSYSVKC